MCLNGMQGYLVGKFTFLGGESNWVTCQIYLTRGDFSSVKDDLGLFGGKLSLRGEFSLFGGQFILVEGKLSLLEDGFSLIRAKHC